MGKLRFGKIKWFVKGNKANIWQTQDSNPDHSWSWFFLCPHCPQFWLRVPGGWLVSALSCENLAARLKSWGLQSLEVLLCHRPGD
jgi:hypothetical protein